MEILSALFREVHEVIHDKKEVGICRLTPTSYTHMHTPLSVSLPITPASFPDSSLDDRQLGEARVTEVVTGSIRVPFLPSNHQDSNSSAELNLNASVLPGELGNIITVGDEAEII